MAALFDEAFLKKIELLYLVSKKVFAGSNQAFRRSKKLGAGLDVADFRPYVPGDDLRHIDWNYYAGTRELLIRLFEEEEDLHIYFLVDVSKSMRVGNGAKFDYARRLSAALGYIGLANLDRVSIVPFADKPLGVLPPSRGRSQIWKLFRFLEQETAPGPTDFDAALRAFVGQTRRRGLAVIISDFYDPAGYVEGLNYLRYHRFDPLVVQVFDEDELSPRLHGDVELVDCETDARVLVTVTPSLLAQYRQAHTDLMNRVEDFCRQKNVLYFRTPVQRPFDELVLQVFRMGGFLR
jgi:uncharacterized protein (DUF58 family)